MLIPYCVRIAVKTAHVDDQLPSEIRITYPAHPLIGKRLKVIGRRRRGPDASWLVVLPDGSHTCLPCSWTDYGVQHRPLLDHSSNIRATPEVLRELIDLLQALVPSGSSCQACSENPLKGGADERAVKTIRNAQQDLGAKAMGIGRPGLPQRSHRGVGSDGKSALAGRGHRKGKGEKGGPR